MIRITATDECDLVRQLLPRFQHDEDNDGQVVLYTDCQFAVGDGSVWNVVPFDDEPPLAGNGGIVAEVLAMIDANGGRLFPDAAEVDDGLCQTCGLEAYDPDCGCICDCHHTCG